MAGTAEIARENLKKARKVGRPKGSKAPHTIEAEKAREYIVNRVTKELEKIIDKAIEQAKAGDQTARRELLDRAYGRPKETIETHKMPTIDWDAMRAEYRA